MKRNQYRILLGINLIIIWIATLSPGDGKAFGHWDKVAHFSIYFCLSIPIVLLHPKEWEMYNGLFLAILMGIIIENIQIQIPGRNFEFHDIIANSSGTILGALVTLLFLKNKHNK